MFLYIIISNFCNFQSLAIWIFIEYLHWISLWSISIVFLSLTDSLCGRLVLYTYHSLTLFVIVFLSLTDSLCGRLVLFELFESLGALSLWEKWWLTHIELCTMVEIDCKTDGYEHGPITLQVNNRYYSAQLSVYILDSSLPSSLPSPNSVWLLHDESHEVIYIAGWWFAYHLSHSRQINTHTRTHTHINMYIFNLNIWWFIK